MKKLPNGQIILEDSYDQMIYWSGIQSTLAQAQKRIQSKYNLDITKPIQRNK